jgi:hypothetical protein
MMNDEYRKSLIINDLSNDLSNDFLFEKFVETLSKSFDKVVLLSTWTLEAIFAPIDAPPLVFFFLVEWMDISHPMRTDA